MRREINLNTTIYLLIWILFPRFNLSMVKIRSFGKKNASTSQFLFQLFYYSELLCLPSVLFCFVVFCCCSFFFMFFLAIFLIIVFFFQFFYYNFFIENSTGVFSTLIFHHEYILHCYCLRWRSIAYMSRFNELGPLFPFNTDILRPTAIAIITIYHLILLPFFTLSKTP